MKYNNQWVIDNKKTDFLFFWGNDPSRPFSQWYPSPFDVGDLHFPTAEHWMMVQKALFFKDEEHVNAILKNPSPDAAKRMGRLVRNFDLKKWDEVKFDIVVQGSILKFKSDEYLKERLLGTGDKVLVEASPSDDIWGIKMGVENPDISDPTKWQGENLLGYALMEARDEIRGGDALLKQAKELEINNI
jgi:ribA/ribD-fused uncharacterized protein